MLSFSKIFRFTALFLIFQSRDGMLHTVLEGRRIAWFSSEGWEESPNTEGRDAA
jgi:hypothetical protein